MTRAEQIRERLRQIAAQNGPIQTLLATVVSVDEEAMTCVVDEDGVTIRDVRLRPVLNGNESVTLVPKTDSWVLISRIEDDSEWMVTATDEVDRITLVSGDMRFEMKDGKFLMKIGTETVGKLIDDLILQIQGIYAAKNTAAITAIQNRFKEFFHAT